MKRNICIISLFFTLLLQGMQDEPLSLTWQSLPHEILTWCKNECDQNNQVYSFGQGHGWLMPYSLRTITPVNLTFEGDTESDLTPHQDKRILLDPQLWDDNYRKIRLCLDSVNTNDRFKRAHQRRWSSVFFEGINNHRIALMLYSSKKDHKMYVLHQSADNAGTVDHPAYIQPIVLEDGQLRSILLHRESNRCVMGIKNASETPEKPHYCIRIGDICKKQDRSVDCGVPLDTEDGHLSLLTLPAEDRYDLIASLATSFVLRKSIYIGKNTYLGLTKEGDIICFWLNNDNSIEYAYQRCGEKRFKDIDVDETVKTESGFMPRIGLLACNGDVYLSDLRMGQAPILLYMRTLKHPDSIFRFFYDKGQCAVVYKNGNSYDTFHVWPDGFNLALACVSLKKSLLSRNNEDKA